MNSQSFDTQSERGREHFFKLLNVLLDYNEDRDADGYYDMHIYQEESLIIIEWEKIYYREDGGKPQFVLLSYDDVVMKEIHFPDNHYEYAFPEEVDEIVANWHKDHPEWQKTSYGTWTNVEENRRFQEMLEKEKNNSDDGDK